jgi:alpha-galactosidase
MIRIAIIGAGSVEFTRNVVADLCSFSELQGLVTIALHDINSDRLAYAERAAASIVRRTGAGYRVEASAERRPAVAGANYVINEIQVGGYQGTLKDFEIPKK